MTAKFRVTDHQFFVVNPSALAGVAEILIEDGLPDLLRRTQFRLQQLRSEVPELSVLRSSSFELQKRRVIEPSLED